MLTLTRLKKIRVLSVKRIYEFYKAHGIQTEIMGASFRSIDQVLGLSGCDLLTVAPNLLAELENDQREVQAQLSAKDIQVQGELSPISHAEFDAQLKQDPMASELLQGGIDGFIKAREQLAALLRETFLSTTEI